jgi:hypothetical protein
VGFSRPRQGFGLRFPHLQKQSEVLGPLLFTE